MDVDRGELPETVRLPDGRVEPFEPERITRSLFAAAERVGVADAFLARELTEGALHFLAAANTGAVTTPEQIAGMVATVVRELGQPAIARAYEQRSPVTAGAQRPGPAASPLPIWFDPSLGATGLAFRAAAEALTEFSLTHVYPRDLVSAHREGLIRLTGLTSPLELAGAAVVLTPGGVFEAVRAARDIAGGFLAIDGPEYDLADGVADVAGYVGEVRASAEALGVSIILNLNGSAPTRLAPPDGPLFQDGPSPSATARRSIAVELGRTAGREGVIIWWHLSPDGGIGDRERLEPIIRSALGGSHIEFVFDRGRGPVQLGPGLDRGTPATLTEVGIDVSRLVELTGGPPVDPDVLLKKVGSLTRFAKTAAHVKQDFLRRYGRAGVREAFLVDRARLVLVPMGLDEASRASDRPRSEFAREILKTIRSAAQADRPRVMPVRVDSPLGDWGELSLPSVSGAIRQLIRTTGTLHGAAGAGRLEIFIENPSEPGAGIDVLQIAAESGVARVRLRTPAVANTAEPILGQFV